MAKPVMCKAKTTTGKACGMRPGPSGYCFAHDPGKAKQRTEARRAGGYASHVAHSVGSQPPAQIRNLTDVLALLDYAAAELLVHDNTIARARELRAMATAYGEIIRPGEIESRLAALEAARETNREAAREGTPP